MKQENSRIAIKMRYLILSYS